MIIINKTLFEQKFESQFNVGDPILFKTSDGCSVPGHVRVVLFTSLKVRYSIQLDKDKSTIHNVDSVLIEPNPDGEKIDFGLDNYS